MVILVRQGEPMEKEAATDLMTAGTEQPDWWSYGHEFPRWHVWRGIAGLLYAAGSCRARRGWSAARTRRNSAT